MARQTCQWTLPSKHVGADAWRDARGQPLVLLFLLITDVLCFDHGLVPDRPRGLSSEQWVEPTLTLVKM